ncbi:MAG: hypothetical protein WCG80_07905 [Spirochaetales bacterium]
MPLFILPLALLSLLTFQASTPGPSGEGALAGDTLIQLADGTAKAASDLVAGDLLQGWKNGKGPVSVVLKAVVRLNANAYQAVRTAQGTLRASGNLWVATASGGLVKLSALAGQGPAGDLVGLATKGTQSIPVLGKREYPSNLPLFNLELAAPGLFVAGGVLVHD